MDVDPKDLRFQYDVIKGQSDSIRAMTEAMLTQQATLGDIVARLVRIESNKVDSRVTTLEGEVVALKTQIEAERNQRAGMAKVFEWIVKSPLVGWLVGAGATAWLILNGKAPT